MTLDVHPGAPAIAENWVKVDPVGFRLEREIGGMKIAPAVLIDSLPLISKLPSRVAAESAAELTKARVSFPRPYLVMTFAPESASMGETDVTVRATVQLAVRATGETDAEKSA